jgi:hypothetical protein
MTPASGTSRSGRQLKAELANARDMVEVAAENFGGRHRREVRGGVGLDATAVGGDEGLAFADDVDDVTVKKNASKLHPASGNRLYSNDSITLQTRGAPRATVANVTRGGAMARAVDRVRVLWPDHLGLARGKYVPADVGEHGVRHCTGTWALGYNRGMTPTPPGATGTTVCPILTRRTW